MLLNNDIVYSQLKVYKIFNGCEVRTENSVTRVSVPQGQTYRVTEFLIRTEQSLWILFLGYPSSTTAFKREYALFYQFYAKISKVYFR